MPIGDQARRDAEHMELLTVFYYVLAVLALLWAVFPLFHLGFGTWMVLHPDVFGPQSGHAGHLMGWVFIAFASAWLLVSIAGASILFLLGRSLSRRRRYVFCMVAAGVTAALCVPLGTILGVLTIVVLLRPSVKEAFGRPSGPTAVVSL